MLNKKATHKIYFRLKKKSVVDNFLQSFSFTRENKKLLKMACFSISKSFHYMIAKPL